MAATMAVMQSSMVGAAGGLKTFPVLGSNVVRASPMNRGMVRSPGLSGSIPIRCQATENSNFVSPSGVEEAVDKATKKSITKEDILRNQEENESEKRSVFGTVPNSGSLYPRPEVERRPETGSREFGSVFAFDGAAPETINGRLAMVGFVWAFLAEKATGMTVAQQLFTPGATGLVFFVGALQIFTYASLIPIMNGESTDARSWGPFTATAERWNGRLAMIGFAALLIDEMLRQSPVFH